MRLFTVRVYVAIYGDVINTVVLCGRVSTELISHLQAVCTDTGTCGTDSRCLACRSWTVQLYQRLLELVCCVVLCCVVLCCVVLCCVVLCCCC